MRASFGWCKHRRSVLSIQDHLLAMKETVAMTVVQVWLAGCLVCSEAMIYCQKSLLETFNGKFKTPIHKKTEKFRRTELSFLCDFE